MESAYYFYLKSMVDKTDPKGSIQFLKMWEPLILEDIEVLMQSKVDIIESLMREYDLLDHIERIKKDYEGKSRAILKEIGLAK